MSKFLLSRERLEAIVDGLRATFGFPAGIAMVLGLLAGFLLPEVDDWLDIAVPLFVFASQDAARSMLETIATATIAVAGVSFSVTIVAFTLSASQLSPRVLRSFRRDLTSQLTLAAFVGTFIYCLAVLVRLGSLGAERVPNLSIAVAVALALISFALFATFIGHITSMLQPSSVIASIAANAASSWTRPYPAEVGPEPAVPDAAVAASESRMRACSPTALRSSDAGFLVAIGARQAVELAARHDALIRQGTAIGEYVLPGQLLAEIWAPDKRAAEAVRSGLAGEFELAAQRTVPQDPAFPVRQLADVALKGLSPGVNDPTTACNAMETMTACLIRLAEIDPPSRVRTDAEGSARFVALAPSLADLIHLGFEQVRVFAEPDPVVASRLLELLASLRGPTAGDQEAQPELDRLTVALKASAPAPRSG